MTVTVTVKTHSDSAQVTEKAERTRSTEKEKAYTNTSHRETSHRREPAAHWHAVMPTAAAQGRWMALISADTGHHVLLTLETGPVVELAAVVVGQYFVSFFNLDTVVQFKKSHAIYSQIACD